MLEFDADPDESYGMMEAFGADPHDKLVDTDFFNSKLIFFSAS